LNNHFSFYFVLGGVLVPPLSDLINQSIKNPEPAVRQSIYALEKELSLGRIDENQFFERGAKIMNLKASSELLKEEIHEKIELFEGAAEILEELLENYMVFILSQYPPGLTKKILEKIDLRFKFPKNRIHYTTKMNLPDLQHCLAAKYVCEGWIQKKGSIWIDADPHRIMVFIREGIDAIIFLDGEKLRREIALRGLLPRLGGE